MLGALLGFAGVSFTHCIGPKPKCRVLLHIGWFLMSFMMVIGLLISTFLVPVGVMLTETCSWMDNLLKNETEFRDPSYTFLPPEIVSKIAVCKFGNGNLNSEFKMDQEMAMITDMLDSIEKTSGLTNSEDSENYINLAQTDTAVTLELTRLENLKVGLIEDFKPIP